MLDEKIQAKLIAKGRAFTHGYLENDPYEEDFQSDQELKRPPAESKNTQQPECFG